MHIACFEPVEGFSPVCGVAGYFGAPGAPAAALADQCRGMLKAIAYRGPDDSGVWTDVRLPLVLGHCRLSVLELSEAGHQPMVSHDHQYVIVFNGEIYNHSELRARLQQEGAVHAAAWRGNSDTETLLACIAAWGVKTALASTVGMFAFALWDARAQELTLARDRMGEKPLYYGWQGASFLFGSELKALQAHGGFQARCNWKAACAFLRFNFVPAPHSIYEGIHKLLPGTFLRLTLDDLTCRRTPQPAPYWSLSERAVYGQQEPFRGTFDEAVDQLEVLVRQAVQLQSIADVPVGAFLSGGVDSSLVVALMRSATSARVLTFSVGMPASGLDESAHAAAVAAHLGTQHTAFRMEPEEALALIPRLPEVWDEPLGDSSQIPAFIVSRLARRHVTVSLSGDGGDELFLGYAQHGLVQSLWAGRALGTLPWGPVLGILKMFDSVQSVAEVSRRADAVIRAWRQPNPGALGRYWVDRYRQGPVPLRVPSEATALQFPILPGAAATAALWDAGTYLPDDILVKVDRAAMSNSLETRAPLLDHRIVEFALSLPQTFKLAGAEQKRVLKAVLYRQVPRKLVDRPKMGFAIPLSGWLRNELRDWAESSLSSIPAESSPFDRKTILAMWHEHLNGQRDHTERLWGVLSLLAFGPKL
jgi:asparagine synthase (glutamine-hydrolysing)